MNLAEKLVQWWLDKYEEVVWFFRDTDYPNLFTWIIIIIFCSSVWFFLIQFMWRMVW